MYLADHTCCAIQTHEDNLYPQHFQPSHCSFKRVVLTVDENLLGASHFQELTEGVEERGLFTYLTVGV